MGITVLNIGIVNDKGSIAEIGISLNDRRAIFSTDVVGCTLIGFHRKTVLICDFMGCGNKVYIIGFTIALSSKITIHNKPIGFEFKHICFGNINN
ncbi:MAG: hypothetical protein J7L95_04275 [Prolixibacteraceae bacterium]|nr:hypothetical protein [Prolixibacteraceae bacterium]